VTIGAFGQQIRCSECALSSEHAPISLKDYGESDSAVFCSKGNRCGSCLAQLLGDPGIVGTSGDAEMYEATRTQLDDNKDKDGAEEQVIRLQKVNGPDVLGMVV